MTFAGCVIQMVCAGAVVAVKKPFSSGLLLEMVYRPISGLCLQGCTSPAPCVY